MARSTIAAMPFPVEEQYIREAERRLGVRLPEAYRANLIGSNGGALSTTSDQWTLYPVRDASDRKRLKRTCNDIVLETDNARKWRGFPAAAVAIGANGTGDQLVFLPEPADTAVLGPALFWWDHETGDTHRIAEHVATVL